MSGTRKKRKGKLKKKIIMNHEHIIGIFWNYESGDLVDFSELIEEVNESWSSYQYAQKIGCIGPRFQNEPLQLEAYCDRRHTTNLYRFEYCPTCGEKIDWKALKKEAHRVDNERKKTKNE